ncbi:putative peptidoglycan lipid II flippase [Streptomyces sp. DvalAA-14]|uniref:murein biosynthesis integral membrane protein MurJ n=1 Tax=unclassified Streptomyces TaxID=2593676 RepID=UPI00081B9C92|nr:MULTISPECIES: murein biosynthesis integral membrane protein MurJ [unclassified Streptomyces]MYS20389.1 murein biosynthesis integral membrane protein MurJ [Streptomyces sp. SID4948]SCD67986.1 putative peptidoglycan lipid II flippase [Streptomyces sp. DvalAA-14]
MNAPYDGDRDSAGQMPPQPEQRPAPPDPYVQNTYAYDPYQQQGPTAQDPVDEALYDRAAHPPPPPEPDGGQHWQRSGYPQMPYGDNAATQYVGVDDLVSRAGQEQQPEDPYAHLFREQGAGGAPAQPQDPRQPDPRQHQQPHQQPQQPDPRQNYGQQPPQQPYPDQGGYPQQQYPPQQGYQQPQQQQPYGYPQAYPQAPADNTGTGFSEPTYQEPAYGQSVYQTGQFPAYVDPQWNETQYGQGAHGYGQQGYDPRYGYPYQQPQGQQPGGPGGPAGPVGPPAGPAVGTAAEAPLDATAAVPVAAPATSGGRAGSVLKSSALMAAGTLVSRVTGFVRTLVIAAAIGVATLGDSYAVANVLPTMIYILTIGGGLNSVFVPQLVRAMKDDDDGGQAYANRLLTVVMVLLGGIVAVTVIAAPLLVRLMSAKIADNPDTYNVAITFARYCLPTIFFMGVHVVMGQVLNARGRFGAMMWTPVLNNIVVIFTFLMFIWVYGSYSTTRMDATTITPEGARLLGLGTLLGLVVQSLAMLPYLRDAGFKFRPRFDWRGHGLGKAAKLAKWTFFFVLANQAGLIVVTQLATWAGSNADKDGYQGTGITAYNNALLIWQMPQAIITVSVMAAVLPRISRAAADGDVTAVRDDISYGLRTSAVAMVPAGFAFLALGVPMCGLLYASTGADSAMNIGFILMAFGVGLIPFSVQYVILRGFYAFEDTRTPFYNTVIVAAVNAAAAGICFLVLPARWAVVGMGFAYGLAYAVGVGVAAKRLRGRLNGDLDGRRVIRTYARLVGACIPAAAVAGVAVYIVRGALGTGAVGSFAALLVGGVLLLGLFVVAAKRMRIEEMTAMIGMVRGRLGR